MANQNFFWVVVLILCGALCGCSSRVGSNDKAGVSATPPSSKEVVRLLLSLRDVPLQVHETSATAGTSSSDKDLGDFISGWLAELKQGSGSNWIEAAAEPATLSGDQPGWKCTVMFRHVNGDDRWGWGVSFSVSGKDRRALQDSVRCLGAG